ncbi:response regulator transcription factor [Lactobacillus sp. ESL0791]|uniref:response regulator transcription factor n=1 Tax=Lactobacillus sp. ESL0791 TaxID=2983234 RepID=UPI0023F82634|nr:response regulator transcription factor [Lactobacillus sp. ESL0791]MDF7639887.1 response regulator transcription factor [Lactobacillus sp. ESL0791]
MTYIKSCVILYIEDNEDIGKWVKDELTQRGYQVYWLLSGQDAQKYFDLADIVVLDIMLPGLDGFTLGKRFKKLRPQVPILLLSARTALEDKVTGLKFADDYLTKPFAPEELAARIEVLLRRNNFIETNKIKFGNHLIIDFSAHTVMNEETKQEIVLTGKEYQILAYLVKHANQIMTKEQIFEDVWEEPYIDGDKTLSVHLRHLRIKLEQDPDKPTVIQTIRGIGYRVKQ